MRARALLLAALTALACARPCSPSEFADAMDVAAARRVLGVEGVASAEQTRAAFHRASLRAHPDKPGGSHEAFVEVTEAYDVLRNGGQESRSGFASGEPWRGQSRGGHPREGDAPARSGFSSGESHAFAWRFSSTSARTSSPAAAPTRSAGARARGRARFRARRVAVGAEAQPTWRTSCARRAAGARRRATRAAFARRRSSRLVAPERGATNGSAWSSRRRRQGSYGDDEVLSSETRTRTRIRTTT